MKTYIKIPLAILIGFTLFLIACQKNADDSFSTQDINKPHKVSAYLTDHQTPVFHSVFIDIKMLEIKVEDSSGSESWINLSINAGVYNILRFRNGLDTLFANGILPNGKLKRIRLTLGDNNSVMKDGQSYPLRVHDNDKQLIVDITDANFDILPPDQVIFWIDFDAGRSIQVDNSGSGNNNGFRLKSHISVFTKSKSGRIEGKVLPAAADALVMAINSSDTTMAIPDDDDGEFKIVGLKPGTYSIFFDGQNNFSDTTISNVLVRMGEDTHLPTVVLHQ